jgi:hypothetical protein
MQSGKIFLARFFFTELICLNVVKLLVIATSLTALAMTNTPKIYDSVFFVGDLLLIIGVLWVSE